MEAVDQNKIMGKEIAASKAVYAEIDGKPTYAFRESLTVDPIVLDLNSVSMEALSDCVEQLVKMGSYEDLLKAQEGDKGGYKPTGLVIISKKDPRVQMSVEFGSRWNKDTEQQQVPLMNGGLTLKWFLNDEHKDQYGNKGTLPERPVTDEEMDIISKLREQTKLPMPESTQPVLARIKAGYRMLGESGETGEDDSVQGSYEKHALEPMMKKLSANPAEMIKKVELQDEFGEPTGEVVKVMKVTHPSHKEMIGIHLQDPDEGAIDQAVDDAAKDGFEYVWVDFSPAQNNSKNETGASMKESKQWSDWDSVDFYGLPKLGEEVQVGDDQKKATSPLVVDIAKKDKEIDKMADNLGGEKEPNKVGDVLAKPAGQEGGEVKSGESALPAAAIKTGDAEDGKGDEMAGKGKTPSQEKALPAGEIKVGKPGDDHGKVMSDSKEVAQEPISEARKLMNEWRKKKMNEKLKKKFSGKKADKKAK